MHKRYLAWALLSVAVAIGACNDSDDDGSAAAGACSSENVVDDIDDGMGPRSAP